MGNIVEIDAHRAVSRSEVLKKVNEGDERFYAVFGVEPREDEPETVKIKRQMDCLNLSLAANGFVRERYGSEGSKDDPFTARRANEEYLKYAELQRQYMETEKKRDDKYKELIGMTPAEHNELLLRNWEKKHPQK